VTGEAKKDRLPSLADGLPTGGNQRLNFATRSSIKRSIVIKTPAALYIERTAQKLKRDLLASRVLFNNVTVSSLEPTSDTVWDSSGHFLFSRLACVQPIANHTKADGEPGATLRPCLTGVCYVKGSTPTVSADVPSKVAAGQLVSYPSHGGTSTSPHSGDCTSTIYYVCECVD
jgi:hypothetical protein